MLHFSPCQKLAPHDARLAHSTAFACQRRARGMRARLKNLEIQQIFQSGLHEFIGEFLVDNNNLGSAISKQYLA